MLLSSLPVYLHFPCLFFLSAPTRPQPKAAGIARPTRVTFTARLDRRQFSGAILPTDRVALRTTLQPYAFVPMQQHALDPEFWHIALDLPFSLGEHCTTGIMQHLFVVVRGDDNAVVAACDAGIRTMLVCEPFVFGNVELPTEMRAVQVRLTVRVDRHLFVK